MRTDHRPKGHSRKNAHYGNSKQMDLTSQVFEDIRTAIFYLPIPDTKANLSRQQRRDIAEAKKLLTRIQMAAPTPVWIPGSDYVGG